MSRAIVVSLGLVLVLTGCPQTTNPGTPLCDKGQKSTADKPCITLAPTNPTASPTPTTPRTTPGTASKPPVVVTTKPPACDYKGRDWPVVIKDVFTKYNPENLRVYRGDYIVFKNQDPENPHSLTVDGTDFDTGILKPGQTKRLRVMLAPKTYPRWHDRQVSYIDGGPLDVLHNPRCAG